jgi:hypothetical protein
MPEHTSAGENVGEGAALQLGPRTLPPPEGASSIVRDSVAASDPADGRLDIPIPQTDEEWLAFDAAADQQVPRTRGRSKRRSRSPWSVTRSQGSTSTT